jgi:hypothetical protein
MFYEFSFWWFFVSFDELFAEKKVFIRTLKLFPTIRTIFLITIHNNSPVKELLKLYQNKQLGQESFPPITLLRS